MSPVIPAKGVFQKLCKNGCRSKLQSCLHASRHSRESGNLGTSEDWIFTSFKRMKTQQ